MSTVNSEDRHKLTILAVIGLLYSIGIAHVFQRLSTLRLTSDLFPRWYASKMWLTTGRSLYDWANAYEVIEITKWPYANYVGYYYPAYLLLFTAPLSTLPYEVAHVVWTVFGLWCLWLSMIVASRLFAPGLSVNRLTLLLVLVTTSIPVMQHTQFAQFNTLGVLALMLAYRALYRERYLLAGVWAGGLLFKPQATLLPLLFFLGWSVFRRERRLFWVGLAGAGIILWGIAEILEPGWVFRFLAALSNYEPIYSVVDLMWNPHQVVSLVLGLITAWLVFHFRSRSANTIVFGGLLAWTITVNALIVPMYGMLHVVLLAPTFIVLLNGFAALYPRFSSWVWFSTIGLFVAGLLAFIIPLLLGSPDGFQVYTAERVYRITMPVLLSLASLSLILKPSNTDHLGTQLRRII